MTTNRGGHLGWFEGFFNIRRYSSAAVAEFCHEMLKVLSLFLDLKYKKQKKKKKKMNQKHYSGELKNKVSSLRMERKQRLKELEEKRKRFLDPYKLMKGNYSVLRNFNQDPESFKSNSSS